MRTLTRENLIDILYGCAILGTGGGGSLEDGIRLIDEALAQGKRFRLATFADLADTDIIPLPPCIAAPWATSLSWMPIPPGAAYPACSTPHTIFAASPCAP